MKLLSWNVNGIRAAARSGFLDWFGSERADVVCVQEIKARPDQVEENVIHPSGYHSYWHPAEKAGYSGVAIFSKKEPLRVHEGIGDSEFDSEGRVITAEYSDFFLINAYFPNSQRDHARLDYKIRFCEKFLRFSDQLRDQGKNVVACGDFNIAHREIDLCNPKSNSKTAGFLPEERTWMDRYLTAGYVDIFREQNPGPAHYTWWSYRPGVREKNVGWRIDYHTINAECADRVKVAAHQPQVRGSDHCPVLLELRS